MRALSVIRWRSAIVLIVVLLSAHITAASGGPALTVDATASARYPISPYIYGMNFADETLAKELAVPLDRWGGDSTTRYNWQIDAQNAAFDYFFESLGNNNANVGALPNGSSTDQFVDKDRRVGAQTLMTVPLIGWTAKSRNFSCSFDTGLYGAQQAVDTKYNPTCGNGLKPNGLTKITGNNPTDTSVAITSAFDASWVNHLMGLYNTAANGGVAFYDLDNEPEYWHDVHFDVHPNPLSYTELGNLTLDYAAALKAADPSAQTFGPSISDWYAYFDSPVDGVNGNANDKTAHGGTPFMEWYLQQLHTYDTAHGTRLVDYFDLHYYTKADNVSLAGAGDAATQARRLRSTRELWDPTYVNEGYINTTIDLLPMMRTWVANNYPGTKTSIGEYNWGGLESINGALAQADVLGIFGREKLDAAMIWGAPASEQPGAYAFRMYRNYDGAGSQFGDSAVTASSADQGQLAVYGAVRSSDSALTLMVINKTGGDLTSALALSHFTAASLAHVYRYSGADLNAIVPQPDQAVGASGFSATYPANSITLVVIPTASVASKLDTIGIYRNGQFYLRLSNTTGNSDLLVSFNPAGHNLPIVGKWTGAGFDAIGVYNQAGGVFTLCTANVTATCANSANQIGFVLGNPNDTPLSGRWLNGALTAGAGVYRPTNGILYLKNALTTGFADHAMVLGSPGDAGVAGDWTGKDYDSPGVFRPIQTEFYLSNVVTDGVIVSDIAFTYGNPTDVPITGDWVAQGHDGVGMFRPGNGYVYLRNTLTTGNSDNAFFYGIANDVPIAGYWQANAPSPLRSVPLTTPPILIAKTALPPPSSSSGSAPGGNQIGG